MYMRVPPVLTIRTLQSTDHPQHTELFLQPLCRFATPHRPMCLSHRLQLVFQDRFIIMPRRVRHQHHLIPQLSSQEDSILHLVTPLVCNLSRTNRTMPHRPAFLQPPIGCTPATITTVTSNGA